MCRPRRRPRHDVYLANDRRVTALEHTVAELVAALEELGVISSAKVSTEEGDVDEGGDSA